MYVYHVDYCFLSFYSDINAVAYLHHAAMDMSADESYHLPIKGNDTCLCAAQNVAMSLQIPSEETRIFWN